MTSARTLLPGEAVPLADLGPAAAAGISVGLRCGGPAPDFIALLVDESGRVRSDNDLVFYNNAASSDGGVTWTGQAEGPQALYVQPARLDADVHRVVMGAAGGILDQPSRGQLSVTVTDSAGVLVAEGLFEAEAHLMSMIVVEIYRRAGAWRMRLLAQGYEAGLAALVTEFGVEVEDAGDVAQPTRTVLEPLVQSPQETPRHAQPQWAPAAQPWVPPIAPAGHARPSPYASAPPAAVPPMWSSQPTRPNPIPPPPISGTVSGASVGQSQPGRRGLFTSRKRAELEAQNAELNRLLEATGAMDNIAVDEERRRLVGEVANLVAEADRRRAHLAGLEQRLADVRAAIAIAEGEMELTEVGIYQFRHRLDDSVAYKARLDALRDRIKTTAKAGHAVTGSTSWTVNGSAAQGRRMVNEVSKLMLRAYNADADHAVRTLRPYKLDSALARLDTTRATIARLGTTMPIAVTDEYHRLRRTELELTSDYLNKVDEEKERLRAVREEQREQARADAEYAREQAKLERDRDKYADALVRLEASGTADPQHLVQVRSQLTSVNAALEQVAYRRSNMRLGYVYVISNIGAFGQRMVKIGMTRRVTPEDRVRELGDASVPFRFDTHALIFSEDAVALETALHQRFADRAVNQVNRQREFFYVTPAEVRQALVEMNLTDNIVVSYDEQTPADEWRRSGGPDRALLPT